MLTQPVSADKLAAVIKVLAVDDDAFMRDLLRRVLVGAPGVRAAVGTRSPQVHPMPHRPADAGRCPASVAGRLAAETPAIDRAVKHAVHDAKVPVAPDIADSASFTRASLTGKRLTVLPL